MGAVRSRVQLSLKDFAFRVKLGHGGHQILIHVPDAGLDLAIIKIYALTGHDDDHAFEVVDRQTEVVELVMSPYIRWDDVGQV